MILFPLSVTVAATRYISVNEVLGAGHARQGNTVGYRTYTHVMRLKIQTLLACDCENVHKCSNMEAHGTRMYGTHVDHDKSSRHLVLKEKHTPTRGQAMLKIHGGITKCRHMRMYPNVGIIVSHHWKSMMSHHLRFAAFVALSN